MQSPADSGTPNGRAHARPAVPDHVPAAWARQYTTWAQDTVRGHAPHPGPPATAPTRRAGQAILVVAIASLVAFVVFWSLGAAFGLSSGAGVALTAGWTIAGLASLRKLHGNALVDAGGED